VVSKSVRNINAPYRSRRKKENNVSTTSTVRYTTEDYTDFQHTGPGTLAGRYLRLFWTPIYIAANLRVGRGVPIHVMSEDFTLYRGGEGQVHMVGFRCAHRGTQMSTGWIEGDCIRCFYHGWKYDPSGQCVEQPGEDPRFSAKVQIPSYPVKEYLGLIFAYLGEGQAPAFPFLPAFEEAGGGAAASSYVRKCNYFQNVENHLDFMHQMFTHKTTLGTRFGISEEIWADENEYGLAVSARSPNSPRTIWRLVSLMPNIRWPDGGLSWRVPIDDTQHQSFMINVPRERGLFPAPPGEPRNLGSAEDIAQRILSGELHIEEVRDQPGLTNIEDLVSQLGQGVFEDRSIETLGKVDVGTILLRKVWARELKALATGQPLKQWKLPDRVAFPENIEEEVPVAVPA
jgi:5,5'-dehydrodivanillate O-demethylase